MKYFAIVNDRVLYAGNYSDVASYLTGYYLDHKTEINDGLKVFVKSHIQ